MQTNYLALFNLPKPQREHAQIINVLKDFSGGDYKMAFAGGTCVAYLFSSDKRLRDLSFAKIIMNDDTVLIVELGELFTHQNLRVAENWIAAHQRK